jgi:hypothetical protein
MAEGRERFPHSVAFRVSDLEWQKLERLAKREGLSVGGLARRTVLQLIGIKPEGKGRRIPIAPEGAKGR